MRLIGFLSKLLLLVIFSHLISSHHVLSTFACLFFLFIMAQSSSIYNGLTVEVNGMIAEIKRNSRVLSNSEELLTAAQSLLPLISAATNPANIELLLNNANSLFQLLIASKMNRLYILSLSFIQRLFSLPFLSNSFLSATVRNLQTLSNNYINSDNYEIELKLLQTLLLTLSPAVVENSSASLYSSLSISYKLLLSPHKIIQNTAQAAIRQIISVQIEKVNQQYSDLKQSEELINLNQIQLQTIQGTAMNNICTLNLASVQSNYPPAVVNIYSLCKDLCALINSEPNNLMTNNSSPVLILVSIELLELILSNTIQLFQTNSYYYSLLKGYISPMLIKQLRSNFEFPSVIRLFRLLNIMIKQFYSQITGEIELFLTLLVKMLGPEFPVWHQILVFELVYNYSNNSQLLYHIFINYDNGPNQNKLFQTIINNTNKFILSHLQTQETNVEFEWKFLLNKSKGLELLNEAEPPAYDKNYSIAIAIQCILNVINCFAVLAQTNELTLAAAPSINQNHHATVAPTNPYDVSIVSSMISVSWNTILQALSCLLTKTTEESEVQSLLLSYQSFTNTVGVLQLNKPCQSLLNSLCSNALQRNLFPKEESISDIIKSLTLRNQTFLSLNTSRDNSSSLSNNSNHNAAAVANGSDGLIQLLTGKNLQCLKALFNISHCLGSYLGSTGWLVVLETFQQLDLIIAISQELSNKLARESSTNNNDLYAAILPNKTELNILQSALNRLFESTKYLEDLALTHVLTALGSLSLANLAQAATLDSTNNNNSIRLFGVVHLLSTLENNLFRLFSSSANLWELGVGHLTCVINHKELKLRNYGLEALKKLILLALNKLTNNSNNGGNSIESRLFSPLLDLFRSKYEDVRENVLITIQSLLQAQGQNLTKAWSSVLNIIQAVLTSKIPATSQENVGNSFNLEASIDIRRNDLLENSIQANISSNLVSLGFSCIQLICNDFLDCIPYDYCSTLIDTICYYCVQSVDNNISFSCIGLLWRVSDYIARCVGTINTNAKLINEQSTQLLSEQLADNLMLRLFCELHYLSIDSRSQVRNSAVKTFCSTICAHSNRIRAATAIFTLERLAFPLLHALFNDEIIKTRQETENSAGKASRLVLLVHYSRDSVDKQWDETRVYAIQGLARLMKLFIELWSDLAQFHQVFTTYLALTQQAINYKSSEVSIASMNSWQEIVQNTQLSNTLAQNSLMNAILGMYSRIVKEAEGQAKQLMIEIDESNSADTNAHIEAGLIQWLKSYSALIQHLHSLICSAAIAWTDEQLAQLLAYPVQLLSINNELIDFCRKNFSPQKKRIGALQLLTELSTLYDKNKENTMETAALKLLEGCSAANKPPQVLLSSLFNYFCVQWQCTPPAVVRLLKLTVALYCTAEPSLKAQFFPQFLNKLLILITFAIKENVAASCDLAEEIINSLQIIMQHAFSTAIGQQDNLFWDDLFAFYSLFFPYQSNRNNNNTTSSEHSKDWFDRIALSSAVVPPCPLYPSLENKLVETLQLKLLSVLIHSILPFLPNQYPIATRLIEMLNLSYDYEECNSSLKGPEYELLNHSALIALFQLLHCSNTHIALLAAVLLNKRLGECLAFSASSHQALPRCREEEINFILTQLNELQMNTNIANIIQQGNKLKYYEEISAKHPQQLHDDNKSSSLGVEIFLRNLFPVLTQLILLPPPHLRLKLKQLFDRLFSVSSAASSHERIKL
jgi:hypothetical protein